MTDSQFDQIIREKFQKYESECTVPDYLWDGIEATLAANRRRRVVLRTVFGAVAAAACVALGLFLFNGNDVPSQLQTAPSVAVVESVVPQELDTPGEEQEVPSIADQIKALRSGTSSVAEVLPSEIIKAVEAVAGNTSDEAPQAAPEAAEESKAPEQNVSEAASQQPVSTYRTPSGTQLMDDYYLFEEEETPRSTHASLSISSNVSGIAKQDGFIYQMAPSHSSSVSGKSGGTVVEELSESSYSIPLSFGVQMRYPVANKLSIGAGVNYTYLQRDFSALVNKVKYPTATSRLHYMGLTASVFYDFIQEGRLTVYGRAGGAVDKCISAKYILGDYSMNQDAEGLQWSANAGVGIEYRIAKPLSIFVDPSASYYFDCNQPKSIRTEQPLMFSLEAGLRFSL